MSKTAIAILSMGEDGLSTNYVHTQDEWQDWVVGVYRKAVVKARGPVGYGPKAVASWAAMRAGHRGWMDLFRFWAERAHKAGEVNREFTDSPGFIKVSDRLNEDERLHVSCRRFKQEFEEINGYPFRWDD
jgi:hypothetical protein